VHSTNTRKKVQLHRLIANFASYQRGALYASKKIFNTLPISTAELVKDKEQCILPLKRLLNVESFNLINEY